jgi:LacI family transcriptional regulator
MRFTSRQNTLPNLKVDIPTSRSRQDRRYWDMKNAVLRRWPQHGIAHFCGVVSPARLEARHVAVFVRGASLPSRFMRLPCSPGAHRCVLVCEPSPEPVVRQQATNNRLLVSPKRMTSPRVLIVLGTEGEWARGILRGFTAAARERDWAPLQYHPGSDFSWLVNDPGRLIAVVGPEVPAAIAQLGPAELVSVTVDRSADGIASVCLDEKKIATLAFEHLLATGLRRVTTFRYDDSPFAVARERAFIAQARAAGVPFHPGWGGPDCGPAQRKENPAGMTAWLRALPKPCGIFTCTDGWARPVARYAREAGLRLPEDLALIGADNDELECELASPPLSSVIIPWQEVGRKTAILVGRALANQPIAGRREIVSPFAVAARRSSDALAIQDLLVARAVVWIRDHSDRRLTVAMLMRVLGVGRQQLERRFRRALDRTVQEEIQRAHEHFRFRTKRSTARLTLVAAVPAKAPENVSGYCP